MSHILDEYGNPFPDPKPTYDLGELAAENSPRIRGSYDAASLTGQNVQHWAAADALDADSANSRSVRRRISQRTRYELANNGQGRGVQLTQANYVVGRGPKLQMQTGNPRFNTMVETAWKSWAKEVKLGKKLRTAIKAKVSDGEGFIIIAQNPRMRHPVKLGLRAVECEQVSTPYPGMAEPGKTDGIEFDEFANPLLYDVLKQHPGGQWRGLNLTADQVPAKFMLHLFREDRAGQHRGVAELHPSLNLFAQGRRYREATVAAAENIANWSILLKTMGPASQEPVLIRPMTTLPIEKSMMVTLPYGFDAFQPRAEQPAATYKEFSRSLSCEQARPINMPYNIAAADSSGYTFSGGKLDHLTYFVSVDVEQDEIDEDALDPLFEVWFAEATLRYGWGVPDSPAPAHTWDWPAKPIIDDVKTAKARKINLSTGLASLRRLFAEDSLDLEEELPAMAQDYGITVDELKAQLYAINLGGSATAQPDEKQANEGQPGESAEADPEEDVQKQALNGAQIESLLQLATTLADKLLPADTVRALIGASFPMLTPEQIAAIVNPLLKFERPESKEKGNGKPSSQRQADSGPVPVGAGNGEGSPGG